MSRRSIPETIISNFSSSELSYKGSDKIIFITNGDPIKHIWKRLLKKDGPWNQNDVRFFVSSALVATDPKTGYKVEEIVSELGNPESGLRRLREIMNFPMSCDAGLRDDVLSFQYVILPLLGLLTRTAITDCNLEKYVHAIFTAVYTNLEQFLYNNVMKMLETLLRRNSVVDRIVNAEALLARERYAFIPSSLGIFFLIIVRLLTELLRRIKEASVNETMYKIFHDLQRLKTTYQQSINQQRLFFISTDPLIDDLGTREYFFTILEKEMITMNKMLINGRTNLIFEQNPDSKDSITPWYYKKLARTVDVKRIYDPPGELSKEAKRVSYSSFPCNSHLIVNEEPPCLPLQNEQGTNERYNDNDLIQPVPFLEQEGKYKKIIWVKFNEEPVKIAFSGEDVSDLVEEAKIKLNGLDNFKMDLIGVYKHNSIEPLKFGQIVDDSFINRYETPIEIKVKKEVIVPNDFIKLLETGERYDMIVRVGDEVTGLFQIILRYIYGGTISLNEQDASNILKLVVAVDELLLQKEISDYLQRYLIENEAEWMQQHFEHIYQICFQSNNLLDFQKFCIDLMAKSPEKIFRSFDFTSLSEKSLISLIERDDLQMKEIEVWEYVLKWGLGKNPTLISEPTIWSEDDFRIMKDTLQHCLPLIRFFSLSSKDFLQKVRPYKKLLRCQLYEDLLKSYLDPDNEPNDNILFPRHRNIDGIIDSKIVNLNIISIISLWFDKIDVNIKFAYTKELYLPYKFELLLRGSRDGFTPKKFHALCDNKTCTITFIKLKGTEEIIGGYNPLVWKSPGFINKTKDSFIFSFKSKNNFKDPIFSRVKNMDEALVNQNYCGPSFGEDLYISVSDDNTKEYNYNECKQCSYEKKIRDTEDYFSIEDYEVFQIIM
ncbi:uncharacterized protein OCT59_017671 [Rhizophagus irregularis]|uniref:uncharacterized protein n=1 Tax=Rhizophagus irregularis TaxID=588596 RepID=UPI00332DB842|nr:hypothetical protein OCT59_017671 [Rhizophagus irregularis]